MNSILGFAAASVWRRRSRSIALGIGLALTVTLVAAVLFLTEALRGEAERGQVALPDVVVQRLVAGRPTAVKMADAKALEGIDSVKSVRPRAWGYVFVPALQGNVTIVGVKDLASLDGTNALEKGRDLVIGKHEMLAGAPLAKSLGLVIGDSFGLPSPKPSPPLKLVGTFGSAVDLYAADVILCDEEDARAVLGLDPDQATDLAIEVKNPEEARVVAGTVLDRLPGTRVVEKKTLERIYTLAYGRRSGLLFAACIPALIALIVLALDRASGLSPDEKREIAIMKAVGFSIRDVLATKMLESLLVACLAAAAGLLLAYAWVFWLGAPGLRGALVGWSVLYPQTKLTPMVDFAQLVGIAAATVGPFVALSVLPAWRAAILEPMDAMRG
ncbi:MAG TPA: FtsX-like permease family protein [Polyangiaceae bacterium]|jgi:ABC-type lipoprotein release transport system permease subunit